MKKVILTAIAALGFCTSAFSQGFFENVNFQGAFPTAATSSYRTTADCANCNFDAPNGNWAEGWASWTPKTNAYGTATETKSGDITSDQNWSGTIAMSGTIHVKSGATLNIAAGTIIRCNAGSTLIIAKGGKINATGTHLSPIIFTSSRAVGSRAPGDWAGILLIGNSQTNTVGGKRQYEALPADPLAEYGGGTTPNNADNSGVMQFVRIEFAGFNYLPDQELNGLTLGAVGSGTKINFIQVSYARDDSFEWFGGTSNHKYLIAFAGVDDDFDMDEGYRGNCQFILGVRDNQVYETAAGGTSNGFEHDNNTGIGTPSAVVPGNNNPTPTTRPIISNATMIGPDVYGKPQVTGNKFGRCFEMRSAVETHIYNSIGLGYTSASIQLANASPAQSPCVQSKLNDGLADYKNLNLVRVSGTSYVTNTAAVQCVALTNASYFTTNGNTQNTGINGSTYFTQGDFALANPIFTLAATAPAALQTGFIATFSGIINNIGATARIPSVSIDKSALAFGTKLTSNVSTFPVLTFQLDIKNVTSVTSVSLTAPSNFTLSQTTVPLTNGSFTGIISVNYTRTTSGNDNGFISINAGGEFTAPFNINVNGAVVSPAEPVVNVSLNSIVFSSSQNVAPFTSNASQIMISGRLLVSDITVTAPNGYEVSLTTTGFSSSVTIPKSIDGLASGSVFVRLNTTTVGLTNNDRVNLTISTTNAQSKTVALSGNTSPSFSGSSTSITLSYNRGIMTSTIGQSFNVVGTKLPASITLTASEGVEISLTSSSSGYASSQTLTILDGIKTTTGLIWARYVGTITGSPEGVTVGFITIPGVTAPVPVTAREVTSAASNLPGLILTDINSNIVTGLGVNFSTVLGNTFLYTSSNVLIGQVTSVGTNTLELRRNALISTSNSGATVTGTISSDNTTPFITGVGTSFTRYFDGMKLYTSGNVEIGTILSIQDDLNLTLTSISSVTTTNSVFRTNAIQYRRTTGTIAASGSPMTFNGFNSGSLGTHERMIVITGSNIDSRGVVAQITPSVSATGYMFELATVSGGPYSYRVTLMPSANGTLNGNVFVRYNPILGVTLSLDGFSLYASHATEMEILANGRTSFSSGNPLESIRYNLRGNTQPDVSVNVPGLALAQMSTFRAIPSASQTFKVNLARQISDINIVAPSNFQVSLTNSFTGASNTLAIPSVSGLAQNVDVFVRYLSTVAGSESGSISVTNAEGNFAAISIGVSGRAIDYTSFINLVGASSLLTVAGAVTQTVTVEGTYLTAPLTVTVTGGFEAAETSVFGTTYTYIPSPADFGNVMPKVLTVRYPTTATGIKGYIKAMSANAVDVKIDLTTFDPIATIPSSINDADDSNPVLIYPNPTETGEFTIVAPSNAAIVVYNLTGNIVYSATSTETNTVVSGLNSGFYLVRVGNKSYKLIVK